MLEVIHSRGLPLDRITTTDVWATDTISANLPPMDAFKARMDERIWQLYRIEVEHLCARNKDGSKRTYEQMFYHVPVRRSQIGQVERERERRTPARLDPRIPGSLEPLVSGRTQAECPTTESREPLPDSHRTPGTTGARSSSSQSMQFRASLYWDGPGARGDSSPECRLQGFPVRKSPWCRKLKIDKVKTPFLLSAR